MKFEPEDVGYWWVKYKGNKGNTGYTIVYVGRNDDVEYNSFWVKSHFNNDYIYNQEEWNSKFVFIEQIYEPNPSYDALTAKDRLRLYIADPDTFEFSYHDAVNLIEELGL